MTALREQDAQNGSGNETRKLSPIHRCNLQNDGLFLNMSQKDCRKAISFLTASNALYRARSTKDGSDFEKADRKLMRFFWVYS